MGFLGLDAVFQCDAKGCDAVGRVRLPKDAETPPTIFEVMAGLVEQGFEMGENGWVCWHHGGGGKRTFDPAPSLQHEKS